MIGEDQTWLSVSLWAHLVRKCRRSCDTAWIYRGLHHLRVRVMETCLPAPEEPGCSLLKGLLISSAVRLACLLLWGWGSVRTWTEALIPLQMSAPGGAVWVPAFVTIALRVGLFVKGSQCCIFCLLRVNNLRAVAFLRLRWNVLPLEDIWNAHIYAHQLFEQHAALLLEQVFFPFVTRMFKENWQLFSWTGVPYKYDLK